MSLHGNVVTKILFVELAQLAKEDCKVAEYRLTLARDSAITKYPTWKDQIITLVNLLVNYNVLAKSFGGKTTVADADLNRVTEILTPSTVADAQLGGIRASTAAMNGFAKADPNLSQDDQAILRFGIAVNYPFVSENDARTIIRDIIAGRRSKSSEATATTRVRNTRSDSASRNPTPAGTKP